MKLRGQRVLFGAMVAAVVAVFTAGCATGATGTAMSGGHREPPDIAAVKAADAAAVLSPLAMSVLNPPWPVVGSDGRRHYAYEMSIVNQSTGTATLQSVQALDADSGTPVGAALTGSALAAMLRVNGTDPHPPVLVPGGSGTLFFDLVEPATAPVPASLTHRISMSFKPASGPAQTIAFSGVPTSVVRRAPVVVSPPLRGDNWVAGEGCCNPITVHRGATLSIDGTVHLAQRFAIDFVRLTPSGAAVTGDPSKLTSYPAFGQQVHAAASGTVVIVLDGLPEQVPGALPPGQTVHSADGNYVVVDIGHGLYAFYAHMQPGSIRVKEGDRVNTGDVLGLLGNTGNTDAPHLHFHIMDGPSPLRSNGVPFVFGAFTGAGQVSDQNALNSPRPGVSVPVNRSVHAGPHHRELPLNLDLLDFRR
jgi:Peptidase family M23